MQPWNHRLQARSTPSMNTLRAAIFLGSLVFTLGSSAAPEHAVPKYKPSSRSPQPLDITSNDYGYSRAAPQALAIGDTVPDFSAPMAGGGRVSLARARHNGPVAIIFYRGHW